MIPHSCLPVLEAGFCAGKRNESFQYRVELRAAFQDWLRVKLLLKFKNLLLQALDLRVLLVEELFRNGHCCFRFLHPVCRSLHCL